MISSSFYLKPTCNLLNSTWQRQTSLSISTWAKAQMLPGESVTNLVV